MRSKKNLESIKSIKCVCPTPEFRAGVKSAVALAREFIRENSSLGGCDIELEEDGNLVIRWEQFASSHEFTCGGLSDELPPNIWGVRITMREVIPMFETDPKTGLPDGMPMREDFTDALQDFCRKSDEIQQNARKAVFNPIRRNLIEQKMK
jgi:hypothetical protein